MARSYPFRFRAPRAATAPRLASLAIGSFLGVSALLAADVRQGLVSYWPLNTYNAGTFTTPDVVGGNHFNALYHSAADVVAGKVGNAFSFNPDATQFLEFTNPEGVDTGLPVGMASKWTVMFWVNAAYPITGELDRRVYSESSSTVDDPLVNIGTDNDADTDGADSTVDLFIRNSGTQLNHVHGTRPAYDGQWHHVALVDSGGRLTLYIDGEIDSLTPLNYVPGPTPRNVTSIGAIVRQAGATLSAYFRGKVDEVAVWERDLTQDEVKGVIAGGIQTPVPAFAPFITREPVGASNLLIGDAYTLRASGGGTRPLTYQWLKDDAPVAGATSPALALTALQVSDSGAYKLRVTNGSGATTSATATLVVGGVPAPNLTNGVVAYWPLDEAQGTKTPDIASGFDLDLVNLTAADVKPGKWGKAFTFDLARQTLLTRVHTAGEALPIYQYPDFSVSLWVKGPLQTDKRVFSEGSTKTTQPLFNIGTHNAGTDGGVDSYIRTDAGATSGDHRHSIAIAFDDLWHHIAYVQREVGGVMQAVMYIDGVKDDIVLGPVRPLSANTTSVGGILRATPSAWYTGQIDDVVLWNRALSEAEVQQLATAVMPTPPSKLQPLAVNAFKPDLPAVAMGDSVALRWDVSKSATEMTIDQGIGSVVASTVAGVGSRVVTPEKTTTYTLTIKRGAETLTATTTVTVIDGVAANWTLLDNFDRYAPGPLAATGWWRDLRGDFAQVEDQAGNRMLSLRSTDSAALLALGSLKVTEGQQRTLFFRMMPVGEPTAALQNLLGLTDQNIRAYGDADDNIGPILYLNHDTTALDWFPGVRNGVGGPIEYATTSLDTNAVYAVWIDVRNVPKSDPVSPYDVYSVYLQKEGTASRTELFKDYLSDRDPFLEDPVLGAMAPDLDKLFIAGNNTTDSAWFDDFYLSDSGYNSTVPRAFGFSQPVGGQGPTVALTLNGGQVSVVWTGSALEAAPAVTGPWTTVAGAASPYTTPPSGAAQFYRARQ